MNIKWLVLGIFAVIFFVLMIQKAGAQYSKNATCKNPAFDKKVNSYLSYSVPVWDVDKAFNEKDNIVFIDAREAEEFKVSHLPGAVHIGYKDFEIDKAKTLPKDKTWVVYCSIGYRSEKIAEKLRKAGHKDVVNLYGSIFEWVNRKYPVYNQEGITSRIHAYNEKWGKWVDNPDVKKYY